MLDGLGVETGVSLARVFEASGLSRRNSITAAVALRAGRARDERARLGGYLRMCPLVGSPTSGMVELIDPVCSQMAPFTFVAKNRLFSALVGSA